MLKDYFSAAPWSKHCWTALVIISGLGKRSQLVKLAKPCAAVGACDV